MCVIGLVDVVEWVDSTRVRLIAGHWLGVSWVQLNGLVLD